MNKYISALQAVEGLFTPTIAAGMMRQDYEETLAVSVIITTPRYYDAIREKIGNRQKTYII